MRNNALLLILPFLKYLNEIRETKLLFDNSNLPTPARNSVTAIKFSLASRAPASPYSHPRAEKRERISDPKSRIINSSGRMRALAHILFCISPIIYIRSCGGDYFTRCSYLQLRARTYNTRAIVVHLLCRDDSQTSFAFRCALVACAL